MKTNNLQIKVSKNIEQYLEQFLYGCPTYIYKEIELITIKKSTVLMRSGDSVQYVYLLVSGSVDAIEEQTSNSSYTFIELTPFDIIGDHEIFSHQSRRVATIIANQESQLLKIRKELYVEWMRKDSNALYMRTELFTHVMSRQIQFYRQFISLDLKSRLMIYLLQECQKQKQRFPIRIEILRDHISSYISCNIRTLNRILLEFENQKLISRNHGKIIIYKSQYQLLFQALSESSFDLDLLVFNPSF